MFVRSTTLRGIVGVVVGAVLVLTGSGEARPGATVSDELSGEACLPNGIQC